MKISSVIPVRFQDYYDEKNQLVFHYNNKPLWEHTIKSAIESKKMDHVIIAYDDDRIVPMLSCHGSNIEMVKRPDFLSLEGVTTLNVLQHVAAKISQRSAVDYFMLLEISHPDRPKELLDRLIETAENTPADSHIIVKPIKYNYWVQNKELGSSRIVGGGENSNITIYQELLGIGSLFSQQTTLGTEPLGGEVNMIPVEGDWVDVDIRNAFYDMDFSVWQSC